VQSASVVLRGAPFYRHGDLYVPLDAYVVRVAGARLRVRANQAAIYVNANPLS
jgi:hypothetical protein